MKFGLFGSAQARRGGPATDSAQGYREWLDYNVEAEALGFHSTFAVEHHFTGFGQVSATVNLLTYLAAQTSTLRLGTAVMVLPWHNPVLLAEQAATLDLLSDGRLDFGVGKGYRYNEFVGFGIPMEEAEERFEEAMTVITRAWASDEAWSHAGKYWQFENVIVEPPTRQQPHPPFWMGAGREPSLTYVAERGYNLLLDQVSPLDAAFARFAFYKRELERLGRPLDPSKVALARALYFAKDADDKEAAIQRRIAGRGRVDKLAERPDGNNIASVMQYRDVREEAEGGALFGTPDEIADRLEEIRKAGIEYVLLNDSGSGREGLRRFAKEIMPAFAGSDSDTKAAE